MSVANDVERLVMRFYYIVFEKHNKNDKFSTTKSWVIRKTQNDLSTVDGLQAEIGDLESENNFHVWLINWKELSA